MTFNELSEPLGTDRAKGSIFRAVSLRISAKPASLRDRTVKRLLRGCFPGRVSLVGIDVPILAKIPLARP
jgi:hypothetical protein